MLGHYYRAHHQYDAQQDDELSLKSDQVVRVLDSSHADWWQVQADNGQSGMVPSNFLEKESSKGQTREERGRETPPPTAAVSTEATDYEEPTNSFKLAAYGVKKGGIGSILAGGFLSKRGSTMRPEQDHTTDIPPPQAPLPLSVVLKAMVLHDYTPTQQDEIKLIRGEYITIKEKEDTAWWTGTNEQGQYGTFPAEFVQIIQEPPQRPTRSRPPTLLHADTNTDADADADADADINTPADTNTYTDMPRPPPVPVTTRPSSLLSTRPDIPRTLPIATPTRPMSMSIGRSHKRVPSVQMTSPDLPPLTPRSFSSTEHPVKPIRPTPPPGKEEKKALPPMARPPKVLARAVTTSSRPTSLAADSGSFHKGHPTPSQSSEVPLSPPPVPRRSMPALPSILQAGGGGEIPPMPSPTRTLDIKTRPLFSNVQEHLDYLSNEVDKMRHTFEALLQVERTERQRLEQELILIKEQVKGHSTQ
ncbi:SH3 domain-containing protein [Spinellus fusiger]|nr:SH3 domain-containing protein [Spinellus fusiger]